MEFTIDIPEIPRVQAQLSRLQSSLMDWQTAMATIGAAYKSYFSSVPFASRGSVFGTTWPDLNPQYESWKADHYPGKPILIRTGALSEGFDFTSTRNAVKIFNSVEYFRDHQQGIGVPQRVMMALNDERKQAAYDIILDELNRKVRNA